MKNLTQNIRIFYYNYCLKLENNTSRRNGKIGINVSGSLEIAINISKQWNRNG